MPVMSLGPGLLAGLTLLGSLGVVGCTSSLTATALTPGSHTIAVSHTHDARSTSARSTSARSRSVRNLVVTAATRSALTVTYSAFSRIPLGYLAGTRPDSVYYAFDPATDTYWAKAEFEATATAPPNALIDFQDGGDVGFFTKVGSAAWKVQFGGVPGECTELAFYPKAVLRAWGLPTSPPPTPPGASPMCAYIH
jgi:hypothetical protein